MKFINLLSCSLTTSLILALGASPVSAQKPAVPTVTSPVTISDAWVKTTVPGGAVSAAYMQIKSTAPVKLVKVDVPISGNVEIHDMKMNDGVMEMRAMDALEVPANKAVTLKPGGMHVMLFKLKQPINVGDKVPLKLTFEGADKKTFSLDVTANGQEKGQDKGQDKVGTTQMH
jgi:periplasmic copper chaperone A